MRGSRLPPSLSCSARWTPWQAPAPPSPCLQVCSTYPQLKVVTSEIDSHVDAQGKVVPGVGDFGDRYFDG